MVQTNEILEKKKEIKEWWWECRHEQSKTDGANTGKAQNASQRALKNFLVSGPMLKKVISRLLRSWELLIICDSNGV